MDASKGFVTLAVGHERYYQLAANLLKSYKLRTKEHYPFALFADRHNKYTKLFDKVIILKTPSYSYNDKLQLLNHPPFTYNIFIDADCLVYGNINAYWDYYFGGDEKYRDGVHCFGKSLSLESHDGWFKIEDIGKYKSAVSFIPQMHGGIIFFTKDNITKQIYKQAQDIAINYSQYKFKYFDKPADEPILALCMAINDIHPIEINTIEAEQAYCFFPATPNILIRHSPCCLSVYKNGAVINNVKLMHWQNINTQKPLYRIEVARLRTNNRVVLSILHAYYYCIYFINKHTNRVMQKLKLLCQRI